MNSYGILSHSGDPLTFFLGQTANWNGVEIFMVPKKCIQMILVMPWFSTVIIRSKYYCFQSFQWVYNKIPSQLMALSSASVFSAYWGNMLSHYNRMMTSRVLALSPLSYLCECVQSQAWIVLYFCSGSSPFATKTKLYFSSLNFSMDSFTNTLHFNLYLLYLAFLQVE